MPDVVHQEIRLDANAVAAPGQQAAMLAAHVVDECIRGLADRELGVPEVQSIGMKIVMRGPEISSDERRQNYHSWLFAKGFQDLARGVRSSLEEAYIYIECIRAFGEPRPMQPGEAQQIVAKIRAAANKMPFRPLLQHVNAGLQQPLNFEAEFQSLQKVRNCLEHRSGVVGEADVDDTGGLTLKIPRGRAFFRRGDEEIDLQAGQKFEEETQVFYGVKTYTMSYAIGQRVAFADAEFYAVAFACHVFAGELAQKLPAVPAAPAQA
jgi:hypothetical protein